MVNSIYSRLGGFVEELIDSYSHKEKPRLELVYNGRRVDLEVLECPSIMQYHTYPEELKSIRLNGFNRRLQLEELSFSNGTYKFGFSEDHDLYLIFNERGIWKRLSVEKEFKFEEHLELVVENSNVWIANNTNKSLFATTKQLHKDGKDGFIYLPRWLKENEVFELDPFCKLELRPSYNFFSPLIFSLRRLS